MALSLDWQPSVDIPSSLRGSGVARDAPTATLIDFSYPHVCVSANEASSIRTVTVAVAGCLQKYVMRAERTRGPVRRQTTAGSEGTHDFRWTAAIDGPPLVKSVVSGGRGVHFTDWVCTGPRPRSVTTADPGRMQRVRRRHDAKCNK
jgi:hypothetical protein